MRISRPWLALPCGSPVLEGVMKEWYTLGDGGKVVEVLRLWGSCAV